MAISANTIGLLFRMTADSSQATTETKKLATQVNRDINAIKGSFGSLNQQLNLVGKGFAGMLTPAGLAALAIGTIASTATAAAIGLFKLSAELAEADNQFIKLNQRTGVSIDFLRTLNAAAVETGTGFDTVDRALDQFFSRLDKARSTDGRTRDIFAQLGFKTKEDFNRAFESPTEALKKAITELGKFKTAAEFGVMAQEAFGLRNQEIAPILRALGKDLEAYEAKVRRLYGVVTPEAIKQSKLFTSELGEAKLAAEGLLAAIARGLMPATTAGTGAFKETLIAARQLTEEGFKVMGGEVDILTVKLLLLQAAIRTAGQESLSARLLAFVGGAGGAAFGGVGASFSKNLQDILKEHKAILDALNNPSGRATDPDGDKGKGGESRARIRILEEQLKQAKIIYQAEADALKDSLENQAISREEFTRRMIAAVTTLHDAELALLKAETEEAEKGDLKDKERVIRLEQIKTKTLEIDRNFQKALQDLGRASAEEMAKAINLFLDQLDKMDKAARQLRRDLAEFRREGEALGIETDEARLTGLQRNPSQRQASIALAGELEARREALRHAAFQASLEAQRADLEQLEAFSSERIAREQALNELEEAEMRRHAQAMEEITARTNISLLPDIGLAGQDALTRGASMFQAFSASARAALTEVGASAQNFQQMMSGAFGTVAQGAEQMLASFFATGKLGGQAFRQMTASILASIAIQSIVKAIFEHAEGLAAIASFNIPAAVAHFAASKFYIKAAAIAGIAGVALAATAGGGGDTGGAGGGGAPGTQGRGNLTIDQGGRQPQPIIIQLHGDGAALINRVVTDYGNNGPTRQIVRRDVLGDGG